MATVSIDVRHLAMLARLGLTDAEVQKLEGHLDGILAHFKELDKVDVTGIEPTSHAFPLFNVWQEDKAVAGFTAEEALMNAPKKRANEFVVPRVVEE